MIFSQYFVKLPSVSALSSGNSLRFAGSALNGTLRITRFSVSFTELILAMVVFVVGLTTIGCWNCISNWANTSGNNVLQWKRWIDLVVFIRKKWSTEERNDKLIMTLITYRIKINPKQINPSTTNFGEYSRKTAFRSRGFRFFSFALSSSRFHSLSI